MFMIETHKMDDMSEKEKEKKNDKRIESRRSNFLRRID